MTGLFLVLALLGWAVVVGLAIVRYRERDLEADRMHELRGSLGALRLAVFSLARGSSQCEFESLDCHLRRATLALDGGLRGRPRDGGSPPRQIDCLEQLVRAEVEAWRPIAEFLRRDISLDWRLGGDLSIEIDDGFTTALANLLSNALEHGSGDVNICVSREGQNVLIDIENPVGNAEVSGTGSARSHLRTGRGRGMAIAAATVSSQGGFSESALRADTAHARIGLPLQQRSDAVVTT